MEVPYDEDVASHIDPVLRQTMRKRLRAKLKQVKEQLRTRWHAPIPEVGQWLRPVLLGALPLPWCPTQQPQAQCVPISGVPAMVPRASATKSTAPTASGSLESVGPAMAPIAPHLSPPILSNVCASVPEVAAQCGSSARWDLCGGAPERAVPTATRRSPRELGQAIVKTHRRKRVPRAGTRLACWREPRASTRTYRRSCPAARPDRSGRRRRHHLGRHPRTSCRWSRRSFRATGPGRRDRRRRRNPDRPRGRSRS